MTFISDIRARFRKLPHTEKIALQKQIVLDATPGMGFYLYVVLSVTIATLGLLTNSSPVIIGAMLLAPLMSPIIGIGLSTVIGDWQLLKASMVSLLRGALLAITLAAIITWINTYLPFVSVKDLAAEIISRTKPTPIDLVIALAGGIGGAYALTRHDISAALPGVAIATALMPPLGVVGIGLASRQWDVALGALLLFFTNAAAIAFAAGVIFFLVGFGPQGGRYWKDKPSKGIPTSIILSSLMILLLIVPLSIFGLSSLQLSSLEKIVTEMVLDTLSTEDGTTVDMIEVVQKSDVVHVDITIQTHDYLDDQVIENIFNDLSMKIDGDIQLVIDQIIVKTVNLQEISR